MVSEINSNIEFSSTETILKYDGTFYHGVNLYSSWVFFSSLFGTETKADTMDDMRGQTAYMISRPK